MLKFQITNADIPGNAFELKETPFQGKMIQSPYFPSDHPAFMEMGDEVIVHQDECVCHLIAVHRQWEGDDVTILLEAVIVRHPASQKGWKNPDYE